MNITKALKRKNKLIAEIRKEWQKVQQYNECIQGQERPYNIHACYANFFELKKQLVELKAKIHAANTKVYPLIFEMSETKEALELLKNLSCRSGLVRISNYDKETQVMSSVVTVNDRDTKILVLENRLEEIQDLLETHNATTNI